MMRSLFARFDRLRVLLASGALAGLGGNIKQFRHCADGRCQRSGLCGAAIQDPRHRARQVGSCRAQAALESLADLTAHFAKARPAEVQSQQRPLQEGCTIRIVHWARLLSVSIVVVGRRRCRLRHRYHIRGRERLLQSFLQRLVQVLPSLLLGAPFRALRFGPGHIFSPPARLVISTAASCPTRCGHVLLARLRDESTYARVPSQVGLLRDR